MTTSLFFCPNPSLSSRFTYSVPAATQISRPRPVYDAHWPRKTLACPHAAPLHASKERGDPRRCKKYSDGTHRDRQSRHKRGRLRSARLLSRTSEFGELREVMLGTPGAWARSETRVGTFGTREKGNVLDREMYSRHATQTSRTVVLENSRYSYAGFATACLARIGHRVEHATARHRLTLSSLARGLAGLRSGSRDGAHTHTHTHAHTHAHAHTHTHTQRARAHTHTQTLPDKSRWCRTRTIDMHARIRAQAATDCGHHRALQSVPTQGPLVPSPRP